MGRHSDPIRNGFFVGIAAEFFFIREDGVDRRIKLRELFKSRAHFREGEHTGKAGARLNAGVGGRQAEAVPFFLVGILGRQKKNFLRAVPAWSAGAVFLRRQKNQAGSFFIVAGEVVEILFLLEDVILGEFFAAGESPEEDGGVDLGGELGAAGSVNAVGFAFAAFLGLRGWRRADGDEASEEGDGEEGTMYSSPTEAATLRQDGRAIGHAVSWVRASRGLYRNGKAGQRKRDGSGQRPHFGYTGNCEINARKE